MKRPTIEEQGTLAADWKDYEALEAYADWQEQEIKDKDQLIKDTYENYSTMDFKLKLRFDKMLGI